jgi:hypothetical protein
MTSGWREDARLGNKSFLTSNKEAEEIPSWPGAQRTNWEKVMVVVENAAFCPPLPDYRSEIGRSATVNGI